MSKVALYRKYRSVDFDDLYGQDHITKTLKNSVSAGTFSHAYLFYGPRGTGKTSAARLLAKAINCEHNKGGNPDNKCLNCKMINEGKAIDIIEIDAASHTQVDNIREVIVERANFAPTSLKYKVYIIDEAHMLSKSSFNALLKTLEEPPEHSVFILATTEISKIIPTIQSRCQRFDFHRISEKDLIERLKHIAKAEKIEVAEDVFPVIARVSEGGFRDAISLLDQAADITGGTITRENIENLLGISDFSLVEDYVYAVVEKNVTSAMEILEKALDNGYEPSQFYKNALETLRRLLYVSISGSKEAALSESAVNMFGKLSGKITTNELVALLDIYIENDTLYRSSALPQMALEVATAKACLGITAVPQVTMSIPVLQTPVPTTIPQKTRKSTPDAKWQEFLMEVKARNNSIHAILKVSEPDFDGKQVCLAFPYKFHKERIEDIKNRQVVENVLENVYGEKYIIKCVLKPQLMNSSTHSVEKAAKDDLLDDALDVFGGEVIE